jgi:hypothetical protein
MTYREQIEWADFWVEAADVTTLPRVLLIGDSIARSYYPRVRERLAEDFACARFATSKCVSDPAFAKELELVLGEYDFGLIHFNNGLHGWSYDEAMYGRGLAEVFDLLIGAVGAQKFVWATTTPVWLTGGEPNLDPRTDKVRERNRLATELAAERGIATDDLFGAVIDHPEYVSDDGVHFTPEGQTVLGDQAAESILRRR